MRFYISEGITEKMEMGMELLIIQQWDGKTAALNWILKLMNFCSLWKPIVDSL